MKGWRVALTVLFVAATLGGCSWFQSKNNETEKPAPTAVAPADTTTATVTPATPPETYVEPRRPWGSETLDNLQRP